MKLSTKGRHAITAMMELALKHQQGPVTLTDISAEQSISVSYLEQLFARLRKAELVTGLRGPGGGYCLKRPATDITVAEILTAVDDTARPAPDSVPGRPRSLDKWQNLSKRVYDFLDGISLQDAVSGTGQDVTPGSESTTSATGSPLHRSAA